MRWVPLRTKLVVGSRGQGAPADGQGHKASSWRVWLPEAEQDAEEGNPCLGIAVAVLLSLPIWVLVAIVTFVVTV